MTFTFEPRNGVQGVASSNLVAPIIINHLRPHSRPFVYVSTNCLPTIAFWEMMLPTNGGQSDQALVDSSKASGAA